MPSSLFNIKSLQSFIVVPPKGEIGVRNWLMCEKLIQRFQFLRILILKGLKIKELPVSLGQLICLRYLDLSHSSIVKVSYSVTKLVYLLSLHLCFCKELAELPKDMSKLVNLTHFELRCSTAKLTHMPMGLNALANLRTLDEFVVSSEGSLQNAAKGMGNLSDLNRLNSLEGELNIKVLRESKDLAPEARAANLKMKEKLISLTIDFYKSTKEDEMVLEELQPHPNLKHLIVRGYGGERLPRWMDGGLQYWVPNLVTILIENCNSCRHLCSFRRLPHLQKLIIRGVYNVEYLDSDNGNKSNSSTMVDEQNSGTLFPNLKLLILEDMPKLKGWCRTLSRKAVQAQNLLVERKPPFPKLESLYVDNVELVYTLARDLLRGLTSLERLSIKKTLAMSSPSQPPALTIVERNFPNLRSLTFFSIDELKILPAELQDFFSLENLRIFRCIKLKAIPYWIDSLISLKTIEIDDCPNLETLPHQISKLSKLRSVEIFECCTLLEERCRKPTGEYWPFIQHIPCVRVTTFDVQTFVRHLSREM